MKKYWIYLILLSAGAITSCKLEEPPPCLDGMEKCEQVGASSVSFVCNKNNEWQERLVCHEGCEPGTNHCANTNNSIPECSVEGVSCKTDTDTDKVVATRCRDGLEYPEVCNSNECQDGEGCIDSISSCQPGDMFCSDTDQEHADEIVHKIKPAFQSVCSNDGHWLTSYCTNGCDKSGKRCADSAYSCGSSQTNCLRENEGWKEASCDDGVCVLKTCTNFYHKASDLGSGTEKCEINSNENCGEHGRKCESNEVCNIEMGSCGCNSNGYMVCDKECVNTNNDTSNCGGCGRKCDALTSSNKTFSTVYCENAECTYRCNDGYHDYEGSCEADSLANCGEHGNSCKKPEGALDVKCDKGKCLPTACKSGYILTGSSCLETNCADGDVKCDNNNETGYLYLCYQGTFLEKPISCSSVSCNSTDSSCGDCQNGTVRCEIDNAGKQGDICKCDQGGWNCESKIAPEHGYYTCFKRTLRLVCESDYQLNGDQCVKCSQGQIWDNGSCFYPECQKLTNPSVGDICRFGKYNYLRSGGEKELEWIVLDTTTESNNTSKILIITKDVIEAKAYSSADYSSTTIHQWLNNTFINRLNKNVIIENPISYPDFPMNYQTSQTETSISIYIFLLSYKEAIKYFSDQTRAALASPYVTKNANLNCSSSNTEKQCPIEWWLRSVNKSFNPAYYSFVITNGELASKPGANSNPLGIRPALWLKLTK